MGMYCTGMYRCCVDCCSTSIAEGAEVRAPSLSKTVVLCHENSANRNQVRSLACKRRSTDMWLGRYSTVARLFGFYGDFSYKPQSARLHRSSPQWPMLNCLPSEQ